MQIIHRPLLNLVQKISRASKRGVNYAQACCLGTDINDKTFFQAIVPHISDPSTLAQHMRNRTNPNFFIDPSRQLEMVNAFRSAFPSMQSLVEKAADQACQHIFDLLGSGPTRLGNSIDWHVDFKTGHRWNPRQYYVFVHPAPYPGGYDIKVPWELSRCQHFIWLGQAYWFTSNEKYAQAFVNQAEDWIRKNPPKWGVNWACTMDVAIRAVNWLWGYHFFKASPTLTESFILTFTKSLLLHGRHIQKNLERNTGLTTNHYLANLVGLIYLGILLPEFTEAKSWQEFGLSELERELFKQTYPDGASFEASISYHRLATELFLSATLLANLNNKTFNSNYMGRLERMLEFLKYIIQPDGTAPFIGDNDNSRLHRLKIWPDINRNREWNDYRYLLAIGAVLFNRPDYILAAEDQWEDACWIYGGRAFSWLRRRIPINSTHQVTKSVHFPNSGICILRSGEDYLALCAGPNGQNGIGGHAHNHALSFSLYTGGIAWLIDPGTYTYTADYHTRDLFRSSAYHNTITIDDAEINPLDPHSPFSLPDLARSEIKLFEQGEDYDLLWAIHYGYNRFSSSVTHQRQVFFHKTTPVYWLIRDTLTGTGRHSFTLCLHPTQANIAIDPQGNIFLKTENQGLAVLFNTTIPMETILGDNWFSSGYGQRDKSNVIYRMSTSTLPVELRMIFRSFSVGQLTSEWLAETRDQAHKACSFLSKV